MQLEQAQGQPATSSTSQNPPQSLADGRRRSGGGLSISNRAVRDPSVPVWVSRRPNGNRRSTAALGSDLPSPQGDRPTDTEAWFQASGHRSAIRRSRGARTSFGTGSDTRRDQLQGTDARRLPPRRSGTTSFRAA